MTNSTAWSRHSLRHVAGFWKVGWQHTLLKVATITEKGLEQLSPGGIRLN